MSFSSKQTIYCLNDQFQYCLLIGYIKIPTALMHQQFKNDENDAMEPRISKHQRVNIYDNEEKQSLDEYENESNRYVPLFLPP